MAGPLFPKRIDLSEADYAELRKIYQQAFLKISQQLEGATDFGRANRGQLLNQISNILSDYGTDVNAFIEKELPDQYRQGAELAMRQLDSLAADIQVTQTFGTIDKQAVEGLVSDTQNSLGAAMQGVYKNMSQLLTGAQKAAIKERIVEGKISGEARQTIKADIMSQFRESGIGSLTDAGGKTWQLDNYSDMLVRTNAARARNEGMANQLLKNNIDLVEISDHGATDVCGDWEGEIVSLNGDTDGYPTLDEATDDGLFHPNCQHTYSAYQPDISDQTTEYDPTTGEYTDQSAEE